MCTLTLKFCIINKRSSFDFEIVSLDVIAEQATLSLFGGVDKVRDSWGFDIGMKSKLSLSLFFLCVYVPIFQTVFSWGYFRKENANKYFWGIG